MRYYLQMEDEEAVEVIILFLEKMPGSPPDDVSFAMSATLRRGSEDSLYQRTVHHVNTLTASPLGILQAALDELPEEAHKVG